MTQTTIHSLPYIAASQAQKHVTHNEALRLLDILVHLGVQGQQDTPPTSAVFGDRYIIATGGSGVWAGQDGKVAAFEGPAWTYVTPVAGMLAFDLNLLQLIVFNGVAWGPVPASLADADFENLSGLGVNATSDTTNRLSVSSPATLLNHSGAGHQLKINKAASGDTGSLLFQTNWSGRAEMGLAGNDDWSIKVSADGSNWVTGLQVTAATGDVVVHGAARVGQYATASRPAPGTAGAGAMIYDTDLARPVWSDGTSWRDASGAVV